MMCPAGVDDRGCVYYKGLVSITHDTHIGVLCSEDTKLGFNIGLITPTPC